MDVDELKKVHPSHQQFANQWLFLQAAYDGIQALIQAGVIARHERESYKNYLRRLDQAYGFGYSQSIVDLLNFYLFKKPSQASLPEQMVGDPQWNMFAEDCNLMEDPLEDFLLEQARQAAVQGHVGILVDKSSAPLQTVADEIREGVYPYLAAYPAASILDWKFERDRSNRPFLSSLKLLDEDGRYRIWTPDAWEIWEVASEGEISIEAFDSSGKKVGSRAVAPFGQAARLVDSGTNPLGEIPFVWLYNLRGRVQGIGVSDIVTIAYIDVSIIRNLSQGEEVIDYAAFPMMRKPMQEASGDGGPEAQDDTGPTVVLEFDPERPESKPDWLPAEVNEPISAIETWIERKIAEIYRSANVGGMASTEIQTEARSGIAMKTEFQMLNARLAAKARNLQKAERRILRFWLKWQKQEAWYEEVQIERPKNFDVENLAEDLANILTAKSIVVSNLFRQYLSKMVARRMLPELTDKEMAKIDADIERTAPEDREDAGGFSGEESDRDEGWEEGGKPGEEAEEEA